MTAKYAEFLAGGDWFEFGEHENGLVDVADKNGDVFSQVTKQQALGLIAARVAFLKAVCATMAAQAQTQEPQE